MTQDHPSIDLNFCLLNAQSLNNKAGEFTDLVSEYKPDVVALTETWFYPMESASWTLCTAILSQRDVKSLIGKSSKKTCHLDPIPTPLVIECLDAPLPVIFRMINLSLQCGTFPDDWKLADVKPRLKKTGGQALFSNLRPISNLSFASKLTERAVFAQTHD